MASFGVSVAEESNANQPTIQLDTSLCVCIRQAESILKVRKKYNVTTEVNYV
jgi:hypothetical protein